MLNNPIVKLKHVIANSVLWDHDLHVHNRQILWPTENLWLLSDLLKTVDVSPAFDVHCLQTGSHEKNAKIIHLCSNNGNLIQIDKKN